jgi:hypothetical protein
MRGRIEAGAAIAAIFLAVGAISTSQDWSDVISDGAFLLALLALLGAFANRIPGLHKLPGIGEPALGASMAIDGRQGPTLRVPRGESRTALIHLRVSNASRQEIHPAHVNLFMTDGIKICKCDHVGIPSSDGQWMRPICRDNGHQGSGPYMDYWAHTRSFAARGNAMWWFKVRFKRPGKYRFVLEVSATALYRDFRRAFEVEVEELTGYASRVELLDRVIDRGEDMLEGVGENGDCHPMDRYACFVGEARNAVPSELCRLFDDAQGDRRETLTGANSRLSQVQAKVGALCEIRRRVAENEVPPSLASRDC